MYKFAVAKKIIQPGDNVTLELKTLDSEYPPYQAGQFLTLVFSGTQKEIRRSYSFNSSPVVNEPISVTIKLVENGEVSRKIHYDINEGDVINGLAPQGQFIYLPEENVERDLFLFAAGVGITPIFSILKTALTTEKNSVVTLIYSNKNKDVALFYDDLLQWQINYPDRLRLVFVFSNNKDLSIARLNKFYIYDLLKLYMSFNSEKALFYTCGPLVYMDLCRFTLMGMGFTKEQIKRETFVLPEDELDDDDDGSGKVVDTNTYSVILKLNNTIYNIEVPHQKSILDVAIEQKINIPYSCHSGVCSTCVGQCTKGSVRMDYNEVLMDEEIEVGRVLVCTGHPTEDGTTIEW